MTGKFSADEDERLIDLVRLNPLLYTKKRSHKDRQVKNSIWQLIASNIGRSVKECKVRWKIMRDYYQRKKKEVNRLQSDNTVQFGRKLSSLSFLDTGVRKRNISSEPTQQKVFSEPQTFNQSTAIDQTTSVENLMYISHSNQSLNQSTVVISPTPITQRVIINQPIIENQNVLTPKVEEPLLQNSDIESSSQLQNSPKRKSKKRIFNLRKKMYKEIVESRNERMEILRRLSQQPDELLNTDPNSLFFQSIKATVDKFPIHLQSQAKLKILQLVNELELQNLHEITLPEYSGYSVPTTSQSFFLENSSNQIQNELQIPTNFNKLNSTPK